MDKDAVFDAREVVVGLVQMAVSESPEDNLKVTVEKVEEAVRRGAQVVCLQELYRLRYFPQQESVDASALAESVPGDSTAVFCELARRLEVVLVVPVFEKTAEGKFYNSAVVIDADGSVLGVYRKIHVPFDPLFYEKNYFEQGNGGYGVYQTRYGCVGVLICYDQWFPEAARINVLEGADIIFYPTAIGTVKGCNSDDGNWQEAWQTVQRGHAIVNGVHVAAVNRVGVEGELEFWGGSFVCDSFGKILAQAGRSEEVLVVKVDLSKNQRIREGWGFLDNRRPDTYKKLTQSKP
ncbi:MAG: carbon-nitrogen hydrolase [Candidatus Bathyarchaeota archaeon]|nr:carbon-nitrogen hydrolase [Candidatus Bathyarchaeota archaeon]